MKDYELGDEYPERVYAGLLGKIIGVRHGAPIESWSAERIRRVYGEISGYLVDYDDFAADDDINGTLFLTRALGDYDCSRDMGADRVGLTLLNYAPRERGFFWWGGYGVSTEHTAYANLRAGIMPPLSGSIEQNGTEIAEQIGGQIFIEGWGLVAPGSPSLAASLASKAASATHGGNGVYGGVFVAACVSAAFLGGDVRAIVDTALTMIPADSAYARMVRDVLAFADSHPQDWRECFDFVRLNYGYDRYPGVCHIIPNAAVVVLSLAYGRGSFSDSINIANMCGWDTDCNVANVGAIIGVLVGVEGIDKERWVDPIHDFVAASSVMGSLNIQDLPSWADYIAELGYRLAQARPSGRWAGILIPAKSERLLHFEYPGSTHSILLESDRYLEMRLCNSEEQHRSGTRSLKIAAKPVEPGECLRAYLKTYCVPEDFSDGRYAPSFSPILYPGQSVFAWLMLASFCEFEAEAALYVRDRNSGLRIYLDSLRLEAGRWIELSARIGRMEGACLDRLGVELRPLRMAGEIVVYLDDLRFGGTPDYTIDFAKERIETWPGIQREVSQFTQLSGAWRLEGGALSGSCSDFGEAYTGFDAWRDYRLSCVLSPQRGEWHGLLFRVQGGIRSYGVFLSPGGRLSLMRKDIEYRALAETRLEWEAGRDYRISCEARGNYLRVSCGSASIEYTDNEAPYLYGAVGCAVGLASHCHFRALEVNGASSASPAGEDKPGGHS